MALYLLYGIVTITRRFKLTELLVPQVMPLRLFLDRLTYRGVPEGLGNSQSYDENIFRVDNLARATRSSRNKWRTTRRLKISL